MKEYGVEIQWAARYQYEQGGSLRMHAHSFYQIIYFIDGKGTFTLDGEPYSIAPGIFFFIKPHIQHGFTPHSSSVNKTLDLKFQICQPELVNLVQLLPGALADEGQEIRLLLECIRNEGLHKRAFFSPLAALSLLQLIYRLARRQEELTDTSAVLPSSPTLTYEPQEAAKQVELFVQTHYAEQLSLHEIAAHLGYDKSYLSRVFRHNYGCTFSQYVRQLRIVKARALMVDSTYNLKEIAERAGFKTIYHFNRVFKELEGISPGGWRAREQEGVRKDVYFEQV
ncbi:AraC family transcriptional regulator [Paenibacillaceae bacterium]|nr:AraC family transcriptional regulator [Paenibacillaceae bacterium]